MAKFVSITAILSHEHEVRFKDGTELRQAHRAGFSHPTFTAGGHQGQARLKHAIYRTKYFPLPYRL